MDTVTDEHYLVEVVAKDLCAATALTMINYASNVTAQLNIGTNENSTSKSCHNLAGARGVSITAGTRWNKSTKYVAVSTLVFNVKTELCRATRATLV